MKKNLLFSGILVCLLVFGFFLGSCDTGTNGDDTFTLSIAVADGSAGMGSVHLTSGSPTGNSAGAGVTVTAAAAADHQFLRWSNNIAGFGSVSTDNPYTFTINADTSLCAVFKATGGSGGTTFASMDGIWETDVIDENGKCVWTAFSNDYFLQFDFDDSPGDSGKVTREGNVGTIRLNGSSEDMAAFALTSDTAATCYFEGKGIIHATKISGSENRVALGTLTISNMPSKFDVFVTSTALSSSSTKGGVYTGLKAFFDEGSSSLTSVPLVWFNKSGALDITGSKTFNVLVDNLNSYLSRYQNDVTFNNGSAAIDFSGMTEAPLW